MTTPRKKPKTYLQMPPQSVALESYSDIAITKTSKNMAVSGHCPERGREPKSSSEPLSKDKESGVIHKKTLLRKFLSRVSLLNNPKHNICRILQKEDGYNYLLLLPASQDGVSVA